MLAAMLWILKKIRFLLLVCVLPPAFPALAEKEACVPPEAPAITDGRSARKQQMQDMRSQMTAMQGQMQQLMQRMSFLRLAHRFSEFHKVSKATAAFTDASSDSA